MRFEIPRTLSPGTRAKRNGAHRRGALRFEALEQRRLLSATAGDAEQSALVAPLAFVAGPVLDLNGPAPGVDFAVDRANLNGLVSIAGHELSVSNPGYGLLTGATLTISNPMPGDLLGVLGGSWLTTTYSDGTLRVSGTDSLADYQQILRTARFNSTATRPVGSTVDISFSVSDGMSDSVVAHTIVTTIAPGTGTVAARHIFYNDSSFDGNDPAANANDDRAIATDKQVLPFDQKATSANYTSYSRGLNGIMIDIAGPHSTISPEDFIFQIGNDNHPDDWYEPPAPVSVITRAGAGEGGSDRVELVWADGAITNRWLEIVVAANRDTGLAKPDTFYFGNSVGKTANPTSSATLTPLDLLLVVDRLQLGVTPASVNDPLDLNRDGHVSPADALMILDQLKTGPPNVVLLDIASIPPTDINGTISTLMSETAPIFSYFLGVSPLDLNGAASGNDVAVDRANDNGPVSIVSPGLLVDLPTDKQLSSATITILNPLPGDLLRVMTLGTSIDFNYYDGKLYLYHSGLSGSDSVADYQQVLRTARFTSTAQRPIGSTVDITFAIDNLGSYDDAVSHSIVTTIAPGTATVVARHIFYNDSAWDGNDPAANAIDDQAIAVDKQALPLDQTSTDANYSNYSRGLNGIMIDIAGPHGTITAEDFRFRVGNNTAPNTWAQAPGPVSVITRAGASGSDRIEIIWADGAIANEWLEIEVAANRNTGLAKPDTFFFGNAVGKTANS